MQNVHGNFVCRAKWTVTMVAKCKWIVCYWTSCRHMEVCANIVWEWCGKSVELLWNSCGTGEEIMRKCCGICAECLRTVAESVQEIHGSCAEAWLN